MRACTSTRRLLQHHSKHVEARERELAAFLGFPAIFEKAPSQMVQTQWLVQLFSCHVDSDFRFKVFCRILYRLGELDGETERIVASPNHFRRKGHVGVNMSVIPNFDTHSVECGMYLC